MGRLIQISAQWLALPFPAGLHVQPGPGPGPDVEVLMGQVWAGVPACADIPWLECHLVPNCGEDGRQCSCECPERRGNGLLSSSPVSAIHLMGMLLPGGRRGELEPALPFTLVDRLF